MFEFIKKWFEKPAEVKPKEIINIQSVIKNQNEKGQFVKNNNIAEKTIDYKLLDELINIFCTGEECAAVLKVDYDTLNKHLKKDFGVPYSEYFRQKQNGGKASLRRRQYQLTDKFPAMAIWLGKQYLNQKDDPIIDQSVHYHYTQVNDAELIKRAKERGVSIPREIERGIISEKV